MLVRLGVLLQGKRRASSLVAFPGHRYVLGEPEVLEAFSLQSISGFLVELLHNEDFEEAGAWSEDPLEGLGEGLHVAGDLASLDAENPFQMKVD